ncbi:hypothetical protein [Shewanella waksmanii]
MVVIIMCGIIDCGCRGRSL